MSTSTKPWTLLVVAVAGWIERDQQAAIVYLLELHEPSNASDGGATIDGRSTRYCVLPELGNIQNKTTRLT